MKKITALLMAGSLMTASVAQANPYYPPKPVLIPSTGTSSAAGAAAVGGFLGFVAALALYDLWRRNSCAGDVLGLGGPGFSEPPQPYNNVMRTAYERGLCGAPKAIRVRG